LKETGNYQFLWFSKFVETMELLKGLYKSL